MSNISERALAQQRQVPHRAAESGNVSWFVSQITGKRFAFPLGQLQYSPMLPSEHHIVVASLVEQKPGLASFLDGQTTISFMKAPLPTHPALLRSVQEGKVPMNMASPEDEQKTLELLLAGSSLGALGKNEEALVVFDEAIRLTPGNSQIFNGKGEALFWLGRNEEALAAFDEAIKLNPTDATAFGNKSLALFRLGREDEARAAMKEATRLAAQQKEKEPLKNGQEGSTPFETDTDDDLKFHEDSMNSGWNSDHGEYHARRR